MSNNQKRNGPKFGPGGMHGMRGSGEKAKEARFFQSCLNI